MSNDSNHDRGSQKADSFPMPVCQQNAAGQERRCGVEIEFIGFGSIDEIVAVMREVVGGEVAESSTWHARLTTPTYGDFGIELDFSYLKRQGEREAADADQPDRSSLEARANAIFNDVVDAVARTVVPWEVVAPPLPLSQLSTLDAVVTALREAGARGTRHSPAYAFGVHFNPELPALDADTIRRHLQAFMCLREWLRDSGGIDLTRRITPYIDDFPSDYALRICAADYGPDLATLISDYLSANPTRNRALDMLPLFAHLDEELVRRAVDDDRVNARPTFHYRLPNCEIDDPSWALATPWADWCKVEALAADTELLAATCRAYRENTERLTAALDNRWLEHCRELVARL